MVRNSFTLGRDQESGGVVGIENKAFDEDANDVVENGERKASVASNATSVEEQDTYVERSSWDSPLEFLLSCISMSVGLGNIWRFPFTAYENGGGAFLIPYLIVLVFIGRPIYFLEMSLGQFASYGSVKIWSLSPLFKGIGYMGMLAGTIIVTYYCSIIATTIFYFIVSFQKTLPWAECHEDWKDCFNCTYSNCPQLYYDLVVTKESDNIDDGLGAPLWHLTLCLFGAWTFIFFSLVKGVQSSGKVAYFTAIFPYVVLFIFLVRGVTLEGADTGLEYFIKPQWDKIYEPSVWYAAVGQCFFSLGTGTGTLTMFASYNPFRHTAYRDALIISLMDTFTSLLAGVTIFAVLGHLSVTTGVPMESVTNGGPGLAFVSYPNAISKFTWAPQLFAVLFFLMLFTLGIGSANALIGAVITIFQDNFPKIKKWYITLAACVLGFLIGLMFVTPGGQFMVTFMDYYGSSFILYLLCMVEVTAISWFYGLGNFIRDLEFMLGIKVGWYWKICWGFVIPVGLFAILIYTFATAKALTHNDTLFPDVATICGWVLVGFATALLPIFGIIAALKHKSGSFTEKVKKSVYPADKWGPRAKHYRNGWEIFKKHCEVDYVIPICDDAQSKLTISIRGIKERITVIQEKDKFIVRFHHLHRKAEINHEPSKTGISGYIHRLTGKNAHTWVVMEKSFEVFKVSAYASSHIVKNVESKRDLTNDHVIIIHF